VVATGDEELGVRVLEKFFVFPCLSSLLRVDTSVSSV
jgi:hypothetical protein